MLDKNIVIITGFKKAYIFHKDNLKKRMRLLFTDKRDEKHEFIDNRIFII